MANINISSDSNLSNITYSAGDSLDLGGSATLTIDESSLDISTLWCNSSLQRLKLSNSSTSGIVILNMTGDINASPGTIELDSGFISLTSPFVVPVDSNGDRPSHIGFFINNGDCYTECESLSNMYADERGLHFLYDNTTGVITVGDNTNGKTPVGSIQIPNLYVEMNNNDIFLNEGVLIGTGGVVFNKPKFSSDHSIELTQDSYWGIVNHNGNYVTSRLVKNSHANAVFVLTGTNNRRITLGETTGTDHIIYSIEATPISERVANAYRPLNGTIEARYLTQPSSKQLFAFTSLYNNGGDAVVIDLGGNKYAFEFKGGVGGSTYIKYSTGYKRTDGGLYAGIYLRNGDIKGAITGFERIGTEPWPDQTRHFILANSGEVNIGSDSQDIIFPIDADFYEIFNLGGDSRGSINRVINNGTSSRGSRDYNTFAQRGWRFSNIKMLNDTDHGNQIQSNTDYHFVSMIGNTPKLGKGSTSSEIITNSTGDQGSIWVQPYLASTGEVVFNGRKAYYIPNTVSEQQSNVQKGVGIATAVNITGNNTWNFSVEYKVWLISETEPSTYSDLTLVNLQNSQTGYTFETEWFLKVRVTKNSLPLKDGYIQGIEIQCPFDSTYIWSEPAPLLPITIPNLIDGTRVVVINYTRSTLWEDIIINPALIDNSVVSGGNGYDIEVRVGGSEVTQLGDVILIKANWQSGVLAKLPLRIFAVMTESGITLIDSQVDDTIHNNMIFDGVVGLDGSLVDSSNGGELTANLTDVEVNINDDNDIFDCRRGIAWWRWVNTTTQGALIYDALGLVYNPDEYNIVLEGRLKIKNSKVDSELTVINGIWKHYQGESIIAEDSETIRWVPNDRLYNANSEQITDIKILVDQYLDVAVSSRATQTSVDNLPTPLASDDVRLDNLDATISSRSTLTAQDVWDYTTRTLSSFTSLVSDIWNNATRTLTVSSPTVIEIQDGLAKSSEIQSLNDFDPASDVVATVTTVTNMRGTDNALLDSNYTAPDNSTILDVQESVSEIIANHNNPTYYFGQDGVTRVLQKDAYFISLRSADGTTELRRITPLDATNTPTILSEHTGYS